MNSSVSWSSVVLLLSGILHGQQAICAAQDDATEAIFKDAETYLKTVDVAGVELGMSVDEARAVIKARNLGPLEEASHHSLV